MDLAFAFFASAAETSPDGRVNVLGAGIDRVEASAFPAPLPIALVVRFTISPDEAGREHRFQVKGVGPDGAAVFPELEMPFTPAPNPHRPERNATHVFVLSLHGVILPTPGEYTIRFGIDGQPKGETSLEVVLLPQPPSASPVGQESGKPVERGVG
jgi:hypothetical protein